MSGSPFDEKAIEWLQRALDKNRTSAEPLIDLDLAIAHHRWGRHQQAQEWLEKATQLLDQRPETSGRSHERMEIEVLRHEAERLILGQQAAPREEEN